MGMASSSNGKKPVKLADKLHKETIEWPPGQHIRQFVPDSVIDKLLTIETIESELARIHGRQMKGLGSLAERIFESAPKLFTILIWGDFEEKKGVHSISNFLKHGITDSDLPFHRDNPNDWGLCRKGQDSPMDVMNEWTLRERMNFYGDQWLVLAPVFKATDGEIPHFDFDQNIILPFREDHENNPVYRHSEGGFSQVWPIRIVAGHQKIYKPRGNEGREPRLAVKQLNSIDKEVFEREGSMLDLITTVKHRHLIELLATYRYNGKYHLLFPFAEANLRTFWAAVPKPYHNRATHLWVLDQMTGIADALTAIHTYSTNPAYDTPNGVKGPAFTRFKTGGRRKVEIASGEEQFGRHGDLKPENMLWRVEEKSSNGHGILIITDLGLGQFNREQSRSKVSPINMGGSQTYVPPEFELLKPISRAFDIWCLGCVYLEFLTWLLTDHAGLEEFHKLRDGPTLNVELWSDPYYTLHESQRGKYADVRPAVVNCMKKLRNHPRSSDIIREVLDLVEHKMLLVDPGARISACDLNRTLWDIFDRAKKNKDLLQGSEEGRGFQIPKFHSL